MPRGGAGRQGGVYVVKLGGSVVTVKDKPFTPNLDILHHLARVLAGLNREGRLAGIVIGGESYGHYVAKTLGEAGVSAGEALSAIPRAMMELSLLAADVFSMYGLHVVVYPPHSFCKPQGLRPSCNWSLVMGYEWGRPIPLVYGDAYPCSSGACIVSGDELAMEMACALGASGVIYATTVPGVLGRDGRPIPRLRLSELDRVAVGGSDKLDVTGGMRRKLEAIRANWCEGLSRVVIVYGLEPNNIEQAVLGAAGVGTEILP
ncbi:kinase [Hyperthermus butylicus]|uniref:Archaeal kinase n=1 Tax=Hyperthermus butylicus (strain DSM 5456 / JCM 9403 / PLM1-5) TaxID=415426 RepID=A2BK87_HYPBU|nr:kinase [Hyperthermus butylicus]ABM80398.1 putative archaeal kinase [Hyperthermus butylicus DSM 5456]